LIKIAKNTKRIAWAGLHDAWYGEPINEKNDPAIFARNYNFRKSSFTVEELAVLTGKSVVDTKALIDQSPKP
jgi:hypothetical protein